MAYHIDNIRGEDSEYNSRAAHLRAKCYNISIPHTRLVLNEFQASCYSYHESQSVLCETN